MPTEKEIVFENVCSKIIVRRSGSWQWLNKFAWRLRWERPWTKATKRAVCRERNKPLLMKCRGSLNHELKLDLGELLVGFRGGIVPRKFVGVIELVRPCA